MESEGTSFEADLHCHTLESDGLLSPSELVQLAAVRGLKSIGITDHDTIQGWEEAEIAGAENKIHILRGIELNTEWQGKEVHILGYEVDRRSNNFNERLRALRKSREFRMVKIINRLAELGILIEVDGVLQHVEGDSIGRPHIAQAMINKGYVHSVKEAFDQYLGIGAKAYVPRNKLTTEEGIRFIREAHGVAVLAHPGKSHVDSGIPDWVRAGLQGIEVMHSDHQLEDEKRYSAIARQYNIISTGGSDFHGEAHKPGIELGLWGVSLKVVHQIQDLAKAHSRK